MAKPTVDLSKMTVEELHELVARAQERIAELEEEKRREAFAKIEEAAAAVGLSPAELLKHFGAAKGRATGAKGAALYRNPENPAETWSGRGRKPGWVEAWLAAGKGLDGLKA